MDQDLDMLGAREHIKGNDFPDLVAACREDLLEVPQKDLQVAGKIKDVLSGFFLGQEIGEG